MASSKQDTSEDESSVTKFKKSGSGRPIFMPNWIMETKFPDEKSAFEHLTAEGIWSIDHKRCYPVHDGRKIHFRCNRAKISGLPCSILKCLFFPKDREEVLLYKTNAKHSHDKNSPPLRIIHWRRHLPNKIQLRRPMETMLKIRIRKLIKHIQSPREIMIKLESEGFEVKHREVQIRNYCANVRRQINPNKWNFEKSFGQIREAKLYLKQQKLWNYYFQNNSNVGMTYHYRCKLAPKAGPQCAARKHLHYNKSTKEVTVYQNDCQHTHMDTTNKSHVDVMTKTDLLLKQLHKCNQNALKSQGFRILDAVGLQDCLAEPDDFSTSFHEQLVLLQQESCSNFDFQMKEEAITDDEDFTAIPVEVNLYEGNDENNETLNISKWKSRKPLFPSDWLFEATFANEQLALDYLAKDDIWSIDPRRVYSIAGGRKVHYRCNRVKLIGPQCAAWKCLVYSIENEEVIVYKKNSDHTHNSIAVQFRTNQSLIKGRNLKENRMVASKNNFGRAGTSIKRNPARTLKNAPKIINKEENINDKVELDLVKNGSSDLHISQAASTELFTGDDSTQYIINFIDEDKINQDVAATQDTAFIPECDSKWSCNKSFTTIEEARANLKETKWTIVSNSICGSQRKTYYRCNFLKKQLGPQCAARGYLLCCTETNKVLFYQYMAKHTHDQQIKDGSTIPVQSLNCIRQPERERENSPKLITCGETSRNDNDFSMKNNIVSGKTMKWELVDKIPTKDMVASYLNEQNTWLCRFQTGTSSKVYYFCNIEKCEAEMCIVHLRQSIEVFVYQKGKHNHEIIYETENLQLHFKETRLIPDSCPNSNTILKEELIINDETAATTHNSQSDAIDSADLCDDNEEQQMCTAQKWNFENKFDNMDKANEFIDTCKGIWQIKSTTKQKTFYKCTYPCKPQCPAHMFFLIENGSNEVLHFSGDPHVHPKGNQIGQSSSSITKEIVVINSDLEAPNSESSAVPTMNFKINMNIGETTEILQPTKSTECIEEIIISDDSDKDSLNGDDVESTKGEWTFEIKFSDYKTAKHYMKNLNLLSFKSNVSKSGVKEYYNCNLVVSDVEQCPSSKYLLYEDINSDILMYNRNVQHNVVCPNFIPPLVPIQKRATNIIDLVDSDDDNEADKDSDTIMVNSDDVEATSSKPQQNAWLNVEKQWILEREFNTAEEAAEYLKGEQIWSFQIRSKLSDGLKEYYQCNLARGMGTHCAAAKYIHIKYKCAINSVYLYKTKHNHNHHIRSRATRGHQIYDTLEEVTKESIKKLIKANHHPKQITVMLGLHFDVESEKNLSHWISRMRRNIREKIVTSIDHAGLIKTVESWLTQITMIPDNDDIYFCVNSNIDCVFKTFRCFLSTRRLLKNAVDANLVHLDSRGSLYWQKNPITIVGTTDPDQNFHLFGIAICSHKYDLDYEFILSSISKGVDECHKEVFRPECLITDDNEAVQRAFIKMFGNSSKIMICSNLALTKIFSKLTDCAESNQIKGQIRQDIIKLQKLSSQTLFYKAIDLFFKKWRPRAANQLGLFLNYFETYWIDRHNSNWFQGYRPFTPQTNNALLAVYDTLKKNYTSKEALPTETFRSYIQIELEQMSRRYVPGNTFYKPTVHKPTIPMSVYDKANAWNNLEKQIEIVDHGSEIFYYISADDEKLINEKKLHIYRMCEHETLDELFDVQFSFYCVRRLVNNGTLTCSCSNFMKNYVCEHSVGMASVLNLMHFPPKIALRLLNKNENNAAIVNY